jgi:hypothetical protein
MRKQIVESFIKTAQAYLGVVDQSQRFKKIVEDGRSICHQLKLQLAEILSHVRHNTVYFTCQYLFDRPSLTKH